MLHTRVSEKGFEVWLDETHGLPCLDEIARQRHARPKSVMASARVDLSTPWDAAQPGRDGLAPDPATERGAVVQVYGARAVRPLTESAPPGAHASRAATE